MKSKNKHNEVSEFRTRCSCGCGAQALVQIADFDEIMIDTRPDGRHRWTGVVLKKEDRNQLIQLLTSHSPGN